jgi:uncharacterized protein (DUF697 family)
MSAMNHEALAGIRLMICMAKADGVFKPDERYTLEDELAGAALPDGLTVEKLLEENNDPAALAEQIKSPEARDFTYASVYALAYCDRELAEAEEKLLSILRAAWGIKKDEDAALAAALAPARNAEKPDCALSARIDDPAKRDEAFRKLLFRYNALTSVTGAIPIPAVPDLLIVPMQVKMIYDIASLFGVQADKKTVQLMFETLGVGTGARIGIAMLSKFIPGWGSVVGATSAFATTYALGKVAYRYFQSEGRASIESLKPMFREELEHGKEEYKKQRPALDEAQKTHSQKLQQLAFDLQSKKISQEEYEQRVDGLN